MPAPKKFRRLPVTDQWRAEVRDRLIVKRWSARQLARELDTSHATVAVVLRGGVETSLLVEQINNLLGIDPVHPLGERGQRMHAAAIRIAKHDPAMLDRFIEFLEQQSTAYPGPESDPKNADRHRGKKT